jgi:hypothetical protein
MRTDRLQTNEKLFARFSCPGKVMSVAGTSVRFVLLLLTFFVVGGCTFYYSQTADKSAILRYLLIGIALFVVARLACHKPAYKKWSALFAAGGLGMAMGSGAGLFGKDHPELFLYSSLLGIGLLLALIAGGWGLVRLPPRLTISDKAHIGIPVIGMLCIFAVYMRLGSDALNLIQWLLLIVGSLFLVIYGAVVWLIEWREVHWGTRLQVSAAAEWDMGYSLTTAFTIMLIGLPILLAALRK